MNISRSTIMGNLAVLYGGGVFIGDGNEYITLSNCHFSNNWAAFGGGAYVNTYNLYVSFISCFFEGNTATADSGGLYIDKFNSDIVISSVFRRNSAKFDGGGLYIELQNRNVHIIGSVFKENTASERGGAIFVGRRNSLILLENSYFVSNNATISGGGIHAGLQSDSIVLNNVTLCLNFALGGIGGGLYSESPSKLTGSLIHSNKASSGGGSHLFGLFHEITMSEFHSNTALEGNGGALEFAEVTAVNITSSFFSSNFAAISGGALSIKSASNPGSSEGFIRLNTFVNNSARIGGGAMYVLDSSNYDVLDSYFHRNIAYDLPFETEEIVPTAIGSFNNGGALLFENANTLTITRSEFSEHIARDNGGAISLISCSKVDVIGNEMTNNAVRTGSGSALYLNDFMNITVLNNTFSENMAIGGGGAVYWNYVQPDSEERSTEPLGIRTFNKFFKNIGNFGSDWATSPVSLMVPPVVHVTAFDRPIEMLTVEILDYYGSRYSVDDISLVSIEVADTYSCSGREAFATGGVLERASQGTALFSNLELRCFPGGYIDLVVAARSDEVILVANTTSTFRTCDIGEEIIDGKCTRCPVGLYSFGQFPDAICLECPKDAVRCEGSVIEVKPGYWRPTVMTASIYECPYESACVGGSSNDTCASGYEGPLCAVCSDNYYFSSNDNECLKCSESGLNVAGIVVISLLAVVLFVPLAALGIKWAFSSTAETLVTDFSVDTLLFSAFTMCYTSLIDDAKESKEDLEAIFNDLYARWWAQIKIILSLIQITTALPGVTEVEFPPLFGSITGVLSQVNIDVPSSFGILCEATYDYVDILVVTTLTPLFFWAILWLTYLIHYIYTRKLMLHSNESILATYGTYLWVYLFTSYMVLPGVTVYIFRMYSCQSISTSDDSYSETYLRADYTISCSSDRYRYGNIWAGVMAAVYVIGVPMSYMLLLYKRKNTLMHRIESDYCTKLDILKIMPLTFLYSAYEPQFWYWEGIDLVILRNTILTHLLTFHSNRDI